MTAHSRRAFRPILNRLDDRCLLSGLTPAQMCHAYGVDSFHFVSHGQSIKADGSGQTIAIVDAYHDPYIIQDLKTFDCKFGLSDPQMTVYGVNGTSSDDGWAEEECLDVEWAHAIAPGAKIIVVEAASQSTPDLIHAVGFARNQPDVVAVSMSFRINNQFEFSAETQLDGYFTTPSGHKGITFLASTGDSGARDGAQYPAASPNVLAVGGTTLSVDQDGNYLGETGWSEGGGGPERVRARAVVPVLRPEQRLPHHPRRGDGRRPGYRVHGLLHRPLDRAVELSPRRWHQRLDADVGRPDRHR